MALTACLVQWLARVTAIQEVPRNFSGSIGTATRSAQPRQDYWVAT